MTPQEFVAKWKQAKTLSERSACQQHFLDLCDVLGQPKPAAADPEVAFYTFERGAQQNGRRPLRMGRRLVSRPLRLGIQGQAQEFGRGIRPSFSCIAKRWRIRPVGRLRSRPIRDSYQLHGHGNLRLRFQPRPPCRTRPTSTRSANSSSTPMPCGRGNTTESVTRSRRLNASACWPTAWACGASPCSRSGPLFDEANVLHVRGRH